MHRLDNPIRRYGWGGRDFIPELLGRDGRDGRPWAELWLGAHPSSPSRVLTGGAPRGLDELIAGDPAGWLGQAVLERFGPRLPFLLKVLSAAKPLSLQAHPDAEQARAGFAAENGRGLPADSPLRNYRDDNHKPELLVALTAFEALSGFRPLDELAACFARPAFAGLRAAGLAPRPELGAAAALEKFFRGLLALEPDPARRILVGIDAAAGHADPDRRLHWFRELRREYPDDPAVLAPYFLNLVALEPGQALFQPARELHAYLHGAGLEIMASSDNVLRGGCTRKPVDAAELARVLAWRGAEREVLEARPAGNAGELEYPVPAGEFRLSVLDLSGRALRLRAESAELLLAIEGRALVASAGERIELGRGESLIIGAASGFYDLEGRGRLYRARVPS